MPRTKRRPDSGETSLGLRGGMIKGMDSPLALPAELRASGLVVPIPEGSDARVIALVELLIQEGVKWFTVGPDSNNATLLAETFASRIHLGIHDLRAWRDGLAQAEFALTTPDPVICAQLSAAEIPAIPAAMTPTEAAHAWQLGVAGVQILAAEQFGVSYPGLLRGQLGDDVVLLARGITDPAIAKVWAKHEAVVICGAEVVGDALATGKLNAVRTKIRPIVQAVKA